MLAVSAVGTLLAVVCALLPALPASGCHGGTRAPTRFVLNLLRSVPELVWAALLGFVGAGGLGQLLYFNLSLLHQAQACTVIVAMLVLAALVDALSAILRYRLVLA